MVFTNWPRSQLLLRLGRILCLLGRHHMFYQDGGWRSCWRWRCDYAEDFESRPLPMTSWERHCELQRRANQKEQAEMDRQGEERATQNRRRFFRGS